MKVLHHRPQVTGGKVQPLAVTSTRGVVKVNGATKPQTDFVPGAPLVQKRVERPVMMTGFDTAAFERTLDQTTGSKVREGNRVTPLFDGAVAFPEKHRAIAEAKKSISFQTFVFRSDDSAWELARALAEKARTGMPVLFLYDELGSGSASPEIFAFMREAGVQVRGYGNPKSEPWDLNNRWHEKHLIVDGEVSYEGGMNVSDEYALGGSGLKWSSGGVEKDAWRDTDVKVEGPAARDAQRAFLKNWESRGPPLPAGDLEKFLPSTPAVELPGGVPVRVVQHRPDEDGDEHTMALYLHAIDTAQHDITIENAYFVPPRELTEALLAARKRGVDVRIVTNSESTHDNMPVFHASRFFYDELLAAGVKIYEKTGGTLHAKTATFDGVYSIIGSANLNGRSKGRDSEVVVAVKDRVLAAQMEDRFETVLPEVNEVTLEELQREPLRLNLKQWAYSTLAWML